MLIKPPYGANLDSAGLFLSAYISPRIENLMVMQQEQHHSVADWMKDNLIKSKHFNTALLDGAYLVLRSNDTSEWVELLDEWEQSDSHQSRVDCLERSEVLRKNFPFLQIKFTENRGFMICPLNQRNKWRKWRIE